MKKTHASNVSWSFSKDRKKLVLTLTVDMNRLARRMLERNGFVDIAEKGELEGLLTRREREILPFLLQGKMNKETSDLLNTSERNVKYHASEIYHKLGVRSKSELMVLLGARKSEKGETNETESSNISNNDCVVDISRVSAG